MEINDNNEFGHESKRKQRRQAEKQIKKEKRSQYKIQEVKSANITRAEYYDKLLLDPDNSKRQIERYKRKKQKLLSSDKGVSNKVRDRRIFVVILLTAIALGLMGLYFQFN